jgi:uncharacterized MAPEG superfamily protein
MSVAFICVFVAVFIPLIFAAYAKFSVKGYNNRTPREFLEGLEGRAKRANWAQMNSFEAFPPFAAGVIIAHLSGAPQNTMDGLAVLFIVFRVLYGIFYVMDQSILRTVMWFLAFGCTVGVYVISF